MKTGMVFMKGRRVLFALLLTGLIASGAAAESVFDKLKQRGRKAITDTVDEAEKLKEEQIEKERRPSRRSRQQPQAGPSDDTGSGEAITSAADIYGRWEGMVKPPVRGYSMDTMGLVIVVAPDFGSLRVSALPSRCLAELKPAGELGTYEATFLDESNSCGTRAALSFAQGGRVRVEWMDMPNLGEDKRIYEGQLKRNRLPNERRWSAPADQRGTFDIVGFKIGMGYQEALNYRKSKHPDLEDEFLFFRDQGTVSTVVKLKEKGARRRGPDIFGEQLTLFFEAQTREETEAADAELMFVSRRLLYGSGRGPHQDNVIRAMSGKYGEPSIHVKDLSSAGGKHRLAWVFDASNTRIQDAEGSACDHLSRNVSQRNESVRTYSTGRMQVSFNPVTVSPECGLTVKAELNVEGDGSVYQMSMTVYDQQRLLGDEWHRDVKLSKALIEERKAKAKALKKRDIPDL